eukprot:1293781-Rhodomonas_salina.1
MPGENVQRERRANELKRKEARTEESREERKSSWEGRAAVLQRIAEIAAGQGRRGREEEQRGEETRRSEVGSKGPGGARCPWGLDLCLGS